MAFQQNENNISKKNGTGSDMTMENQKEMNAGTIDGRVRLCPDGKYRWYYEFPMLRNPVIFTTVLKIGLLSALAPALIVFFASLSDGFPAAGKAFLTVYGISFGLLLVLSFLGYFITAAIYGFKYIVLFEMDEKSITHAQQDKQFKKAEAISFLTMAAGAVSGKPGITGIGMLSGSRQQRTSSFENVKSVIGLRSKDTIKVNQALAKNQIYVHPADYDFVFDFISSRCQNATVR